MKLIALSKRLVLPFPHSVSGIVVLLQTTLVLAVHVKIEITQLLGKLIAILHVIINNNAPQHTEPIASGKKTLNQKPV